jgi:alpha-amylase/alpha-mannosidase (GH57 family)
MASTAKNIDNKIIHFLKLLNSNEKKAVLKVVETFAQEHEDEFSNEEKAELDELKKLHSLGKSKSYTVVQVRKNAYAALKK